MKTTFLLFTLLLLFFNSLIAQDTLRVPTQYLTIRSAIDASSNGDLVLVDDGIYYENINFTSKAITVASNFIIDADTNHIYNTIINGSQNSNPDSGSVVYFISGEDTTSILTGFTITGGSGTLVVIPGVETDRIGGGIYLEDSGAKIIHNRIINNSADMNISGSDARVAAGGGIAALSVEIHNLIIENNFISDNTVFSVSRAFGGGIAVIENSPGVYNVLLLNNTIASNEVVSNGMGDEALAVSGGILTLLGKVIVIGNTVSGNAVNSMNLSIGAGVTIASSFAEEESRFENNFISNNSFQNAICLGGGVHLSVADGVTIYNNRIKSNSAAFGGGLFIDTSIPFLSKNLIAGNSALQAGGGMIIEYSAILTELYSELRLKQGGSWASIIFSSKEYVKSKIDRVRLLNDYDLEYVIQENPNRIVEVVNNTIAGNSALNSLGGTAIAVFNSTVKIFNSIIWGNQPSSNPHIDGPAFVNYSDVEGGFAGTGNINADPLFADQINYYLDPANSPCIDAGHPDTLYNDPEDPQNPGFALWPALGILRNDMGAYGGNENMKNSGELLGPLFRAFVNRVNSVPINEKQAIIDSFMNATTSFPTIEENTVAYYIYQGGTGSVTVPGDANGWNPDAFPMTKLDGTIFWYREAVFEPDARLDYKFVLNGTTWILDPLNPNHVSGGFGPNSELAMPEYVQPPEIQFNAGIPHGSIHTFSFTSTNLGNTRTIKVYTPPGYESHPEYYYPVILFHDGLEYLTLGSANNIIDYLLNEGKINPIIAVFVPPVNRDDEYAWNLTQQFESFIIEELMPHIDTTYRTYSDPEYRAMTGLSYGGLITTQICYNRPGDFGLSAPYSPSYWAKDMEVFNSVMNGPKKEIKWYIDWGTYETTIMVDARMFKEGLTAKGYDFTWSEWHEGHSWGSWRAHLDIALEYFFPKTVDVADKNELPDQFNLAQNFPNPFNPETTIRYSVPKETLVSIKIYNSIGEEVVVLVDEVKLPGIYEIGFDAARLSSGVYFYRLQSDSFTETKKMLFLK